MEIQKKQIESFYYYVNEKGEYLSGPFVYCDNFSEGIGRVKKNNEKRYYVNKEGKEIAGPYEHCWDFEKSKECDKKGSVVDEKVEDIKVGDCIFISYEEHGRTTKIYTKATTLKFFDGEIFSINLYPANLVKLCSKEEINKYFKS